MDNTTIEKNSKQVTIRNGLNPNEYNQDINEANRAYRKGAFSWVYCRKIQESEDNDIIEKYKKYNLKTKVVNSEDQEDLKKGKKILEVYFEFKLSKVNIEENETIVIFTEELISTKGSALRFFRDGPDVSTVHDILMEKTTFQDQSLRTWKGEGNQDFFEVFKELYVPLRMQLCFIYASPLL